ncbi:hypothetical protein QFC22_005569 [Naganishia vaughanmartiniae]|uniref:Uncharacterized protein n=1 Tax=Naganishia vaughanmartiniae TaxID=1424756 RepID=A0ACC2WTC6_9TREE|nr:hypothetical protein QFC22_005569 [Naganishia vaughanmartiniae]
MSTPSATPAPEAAQQQQQQPSSIRLEILNPHTTPPSTFHSIFHLLASAFGGSGGSSPIWDNMYPPPRPALEEQAAVGARQHAWEIKNPDVVYVVALGSFPDCVDGEERPLGLAIWGKPGYRWSDLVERNKMGEEEREAYVGYNLEFRNEWRRTLQSHRDRLMGAELYWYLSVLAVDPAYQKYKIGSQLIDHGLALADAASLPALLESSPAGKRLYESRGFIKEGEYPSCTTWKGMEELRFPLYRRPAVGKRVKVDSEEGLAME